MARQGLSGRGEARPGAAGQGKEQIKEGKMTLPIARNGTGHAVKIHRGPGKAALSRDSDTAKAPVKIHRTPECKAIGCSRRTRHPTGYCFQHTQITEARNRFLALIVAPTMAWAAIIATWWLS